MQPEHDCGARWPEDGGEYCQTPASEPHELHDAIATGGWLTWCHAHRYGGTLDPDEVCEMSGCDFCDDWGEYPVARAAGRDRKRTAKHTRMKGYSRSSMPSMRGDDS